MYCNVTLTCIRLKYYASIKIFPALERLNTGEKLKPLKKKSVNTRGTNTAFILAKIPGTL